MLLPVVVLDHAMAGCYLSLRWLEEANGLSQNGLSQQVIYVYILYTYILYKVPTRPLGHVAGFSSVVEAGSGRREPLASRWNL